MKNFMFSIKQGILGHNFLISLIVGFFLLISPIWNILVICIKNSVSLDYCYILNSTVGNGSFCVFAPLFATISYTASFSDEMKSGLIRDILIRENKMLYLLKKMMANSICGGLTLSTPLIILTIVSIIFGVPYSADDIPAGNTTIFENTIFESFQFVWGGLLVSLVCVFLTFLSGMVWSNVGLCLSAFIQNKYIAVGFPLVLYYGLSVVLYGTDFYGFSPISLMFPLIIDNVSLCTNILFQCLELFVVDLIFIIKGRRTLKNV